MKKLFCSLFAVAGLTAAAGQIGTGGRESYEMVIFVLENRGASMLTKIDDFDGGNGGVILNGSVDITGTALTAKGNNLTTAKRMTVKVSGLNNACKFDTGKLFKLEVNKIPIVTSTETARNTSDLNYIRARNGEFTFDLSKAGNINEMSLIFYNCFLKDVKFEMFVE